MYRGITVSEPELAMRTENTRDRRHLAIFRVLWRHFEIVANACIANGGRIAIEWPRACRYWRNRRVASFLKRHGCMQYKFDGCMYNLRSQCGQSRGNLLRKPWTIASNCSSFQRLCRVCNHDRAVEPHAPTQGGDTRLTESYTDSMVERIHSCWRHGYHHDTTNDDTTTTPQH